MANTEARLRFGGLFLQIWTMHIQPKAFCALAEGK
jgi:hypothetical protein